MKKTVILAVLGVAASVATSYGQGYIVFSSYAQPVSNLITFAQGGAVVDGGGFVASLYYAIGTVSDPVGPGLPSGAFTLANNATAGTYPTPIIGGFFDGSQLVIPGYAGGAITFEVYASNGAGTTGRSGSFTEALGIRTDGVYSIFGDNGQAVMPAFTVAAVPEPATLALAGLGGLASLVALRRKQA